MMFPKLFRKETTTSEQNDMTSAAEYEFCPRCDANLTLQKGYSNDLPNWICKGCGEMLINPAIDSDIIWICDKCGVTLNIQEGFNDECGSWKCTQCGFENAINDDEVYASDDEYQAEMNNPYRGLSDEEILEIMEYEEIDNIAGRDDITLERGRDSILYVRKILKTFDIDVISYLYENPVSNMPRIKAVYKAENFLILIEEYIEGTNLEDAISVGPLGQEKAIEVALSVSKILKQLHELARPVIHRDIKPSNIIISNSGEVYLLDVNVAKWYKEGEQEDTTLLGTKDYAAPEQYGFGFSASSAKTDIYALGILLNVMITGKLPKEEKAVGDVWSVIEHCISIEQADRYNDDELIVALESL